jgi:hypothetical protein
VDDTDREKLKGKTEGKTEELRENRVPVSLHPQQTGLSYAWRKTFALVKPYWNFCSAKPVYTLFIQLKPSYRLQHRFNDTRQSEKPEQSFVYACYCVIFNVFVTRQVCTPIRYYSKNVCALNYISLL